MVRGLKQSVVMATIAFALGGMVYEGSARQAMAETLFDDVNVGLFSSCFLSEVVQPISIPNREIRTGLVAVRSESIRSTFLPLKAPSTIAGQKSILPPSEPFRYKAPCCSILLA